MAPVQERYTVSVREAVARKILKLRAKLGITSADLSPSSVALTSRECDKGCEGAGDKPSSPTDSRRDQVDINDWRMETEKMMSLLGSCDYPMAELKREVGELTQSYTKSLIASIM